jgi:hypothetical protein
MNQKIKKVKHNPLPQEFVDFPIRGFRILGVYVLLNFEIYLWVGEMFFLNVIIYYKYVLIIHFAFIFAKIY